ncbi:MAG: hypothetical protein ACREP0_09325 [Rhodanobacteraceae bacterium]
MLKELANLSYQMLQLHGHVIDSHACHADAGGGRRIQPAERRGHERSGPAVARARGHDRLVELVALAVIWGSACLLLLVSASALFTPFEI